MLELGGRAGAVFLVVECIKGGLTYQRLRQQAPARGFIHLDVKPANISPSVTGDSWATILPAE